MDEEIFEEYREITYPVVLEFDPENLGLLSFAGKVRKSKCWKEVVKANDEVLTQFVQGIKEEYDETEYIECAQDVFSYFGDKVLRTTLDTMHIMYNDKLAMGTMRLVKGEISE